MPPAARSSTMPAESRTPTPDEERMSITFDTAELSQQLAPAQARPKQDFWSVARPWKHLAAGAPRIAHVAYDWHRA
jgi:hypothetical protein